MATLQLTEHFTLAEFTASDTADKLGIDNALDADIFDELHGLAELMEDVRARLGDDPIFITSGYRCVDLNAAVGGAADSAHLYGRAADFVCPKFGTPLEICRALEPLLEELGIDQLIYECGTDSPGDEWVHLGLALPGDQPRCQALTINSAGTFNGFA
jgi:L-asparaginase II